MERRVWRFRDERETQFATRITSRDRLWDGFTATIYDATSGYSEVLFASHSLSMHVGEPVMVTSRCDGPVVRRLQVLGDLKLVPAGYSRIWETEGPASKLVINLSPALVRATADSMGLDADRIDLQPHVHLRDRQLEHVVWALKAELEAPEPLGRVYAESLGSAIAALLLRRYGSERPRSARGLSKRRLRRVLDYIRTNVAQDLTLAELAGVAGASPSHFKYLFKQSMGMPVHQYVVRSRVEAAIGLLLEQRHPICDVALQSGFANQSHLAAWMRRVAGVSPRDLRDMR